MTREINCHQFQDRLDTVLDHRQRLQDDRILTRHAAECIECQQLFADYQAIDDFVQQQNSNADTVWNSQPTKPVISQQTLTSDFVTRLTLVVGSLAAILLVSISLINPNTNNADDSVAKSELVTAAQGLEQPSQARNQASIKNLLPPIKPYVDESIILIGSKISEGQMTLARNSIKPANFTASLHELREKLTPLSAYYQYSVELPGLRPVRTSLNATFDLIKKSLTPDQVPPAADQPDLGNAGQHRQYYT